MDQPKFWTVRLPIEVTKDTEYHLSWTWDRLLRDCHRSKELENKHDLHMSNLFVPVNAFREHRLRNFVVHFTRDMLFQVEHSEFANDLPFDASACWVAVLVKMAGYRALMRWVGCENDTHDFWINVASTGLHAFSTTDQPSIGMIMLPPPFVSSSWDANTGAKAFLTAALMTPSNRTIIPEFETAQKQTCKGGKLKVGQRVELLDYYISSQVRPARVAAVAGRRACLQVLETESQRHDEDYDKQYGKDSQFWVDEDSLFIFHVGWAALNGYKLVANSDYTKHSAQVANAIRAGESSVPYNDIDTTAEQMRSWKNAPHHSGQTFQKGMKLELLDPLAGTIGNLVVASVLEVLKDGYVRVGADGPEANDECIPLHFTNPNMFPVGYAEKYGLKLVGPGGDGCNAKFEWEPYLRETKSIAAPEYLFAPIPDTARMNMFKVGARLEASDMVENCLIYPATVASLHGRVIKVHFDGWEDESDDQCFDVNSNDMFPIGWCEMHGHKLEAPKGEKEPPAKKMKKKNM